MVNWFAAVEAGMVSMVTEGGLMALDLAVQVSGPGIVPAVLSV